jgi:glucose/arabinose dehydrogenase
MGLAAVAALVAGVLVVTSGNDGPVDRVAIDEGTTSSSTSTTTDAVAEVAEKDDVDLGGIGGASTTAPPGGEPTTTPPTAPPAPPAPRPPPTAPTPLPLRQIRVRLAGVATLNAPIAAAPRPGSGELWVAEQGGRVVALVNGVVTTVDISADTEASGEQGLLGLAFDGSGSRLYLSYTDNGGDSRVDEFTVSASGVVDLASRRAIPIAGQAAIDQPYANHNGGHLTLGPDGAIWLGLGDGGSGGDPQGHAQRDGDPLGKLLRFAPGGGGFEIVARGLRNPWRFSFDRATGDLWVADVGQSQYEEINVVRFDGAFGANFGWNRREGTHFFAGSAVAGDVEPVFEYTHGRGCSVTGGYVYRGSRIPALVGTYVYGDFCEGVVRGLRIFGEESSLGVSPGGISSFGQDLAGELYVLSLDGGVYRLDPA